MEREFLNVLKPEEAKAILEDRQKEKEFEATLEGKRKGLVNPLTGKPYMGSQGNGGELTRKEVRTALTGSADKGKPLNTGPKERLNALKFLEENREKWADLFMARLLYDRIERRDNLRDAKIAVLQKEGLASFIAKELSGSFVKDLQNYLDHKDSPLYKDIFPFRSRWAGRLSTPGVSKTVHDFNKGKIRPPNFERVVSLLDEWRNKIDGADRLSSAVASRMLYDFKALNDVNDALAPYLPQGKGKKNEDDDWAEKMTEKHLKARGLGKPDKLGRQRRQGKGDTEPVPSWALGLAGKYDLPVSGVFNDSFNWLVREAVTASKQDSALAAAKAKESAAERDAFAKDVKEWHDAMDARIKALKAASIAREEESARVSREELEKEKLRSKVSEAYGRGLAVLRSEPFQYSDFERVEEIASELKELGDSAAAEELVRLAGRRVRKEVPPEASKEEQERKLDNQLAGYIEKIQEYASAGEDETAAYYVDRYNEVAAKNGRPPISDRRMKRKKPKKGMTHAGRLGAFLSGGLLRIGGE